MRRDELQPGQFYLYNTNRDPIRDAYGESKVRVIDTGHWSRQSYYYSFTRDERPKTRIVLGDEEFLIQPSLQLSSRPVQGSGVLVQFYVGDKPGSFKVARLMDIHGLWDELHPKVEEELKRRNTERQKQAIEYERRKAKFATVKEQLESLGFTLVRGGGAESFLILDEANTDKLLGQLVPQSCQ